MIVNTKKYLKTIFSLPSKLSDNWSIAKKISYGYTVAISIAFIGTTSGLLIAYRYETLAQEQLNLSYQQQSILKNLENTITKVRLHPQRLVTVLENTIWLEFEKNKFLDEINQINQQLSELQIFVNTHPDNLKIDNTDLLKLLNNYQINTQKYTKKVKLFWQQIEQNKLSANEAKANQEHPQTKQKLTRNNYYFFLIKKLNFRLILRNFQTN